MLGQQFLWSVVGELKTEGHQEDYSLVVVDQAFKEFVGNGEQGDGS